MIAANTALDTLIAVGILGWFVGFCFFVWDDITRLCDRMCADDVGADDSTRALGEFGDTRLRRHLPERMGATLRQRNRRRMTRARNQPAGDRHNSLGACSVCETSTAPASRGAGGGDAE